MQAFQTRRKIGFGILAHFTFPLIILESYSKYKEVSQALESYGFDSIWFNDHFWTYPEPTNKPVYETITLMSAIASNTEKIKLGSMVLSHSYRNPALLAKQLACVDQISKGRLICGIGGGWYEEEYDAYGYEFPKASTRLTQLEEAIQVIKLMWTEEKPSFEGKFHRIRDAYCVPKPVQTPNPPILVGGSGEKKTLKLVARYANAANIMGNVETIVHKYTVLENYCNMINRPYSEIKRTTNLFIHISNSKKELEKEINWYKDNHPRERIRSQTKEEYLKTRIHGSPDECIKGIQGFIDLGMQYLIFMFPKLGDLRGPKLFADEVLPSF